MRRAVVQRILVVEDEKDIAEAVRDVLATLDGTEVETAYSAKEGRAKALEGAWALVLSDERLPDGRGVDLLAEVSRAQPETVRALMSAFSDFDVMKRAVNVAHIDRFFLKPVEPSEILGWVRSALDQQARGSVAARARSGVFGRVGSIGPATGRRPPL